MIIMADLKLMTEAELANQVDGACDPMRQECARRLRAMSIMRDQLADAVRQVNDAERTLQRYDACIDAITQLVWPACTDVQADSPEYLTKLVTRVGALARVTANDAQAWEVLKKHVVSNGRLSKLVCAQREQLRHLEAERTELAARVLDLEDDLEMATTAYGVLRDRLKPPVVLEGYDANGAPC